MAMPENRTSRQSTQHEGQAGTSAITTSIARNVWPALVAAALFGASTPLIKLLVGEMHVLLLAGLLYLGSGIGLICLRLMRDRGWKHSGMAVGEWRWLAGSVAFGGILGPALFVWGLTRTDAGVTSLLLNLEGVFTAVLAWVVFRESTGRRIILGMGLIVAGGAVLLWPTAGALPTNWIAFLAIVAACGCWGLDNNLTRHVAGADAMFIAGIKGLVAGLVNAGLGFMLGASITVWSMAVYTMLLGSIAYGLSLYFFVSALRNLGTARTGAYFATGPFVGAAISLVLMAEPTPVLFWVAAALMAMGIWLHLTERHDHEHSHDLINHSHAHRHDAHHHHSHEFEWDGHAPHTHSHRHDGLRHKHAHFPDMHHRHTH